MAVALTAVVVCVWLSVHLKMKQTQKSLPRNQPTTNANPTSTPSQKPLTTATKATTNPATSTDSFPVKMSTTDNICTVRRNTSGNSDLQNKSVKYFVSKHNYALCQC